MSYQRQVRRLTGAGGPKPYILAMTIPTCPSPSPNPSQRERCATCEPDNRPTKPMPFFLGGTIDVDLADIEAAADFLEMVARVIRQRKRLRISIE